MQVFLVAVRDHFLDYFEALEKENGRYFNFDNLPRLQVDQMNRVFQLHLWDVALQEGAYHAYHNLAIITNDDFLGDALDMAVSYHEFCAVLSLCARIQRLYPQKRILPHIVCSDSCGDCEGMRITLLKYAEFKADWDYTRERIREAKEKGLWMMRRPYMYFSSKTDAVMKQIDKNNRKGWNTVLTAVLIVRMWRQWMRRQVEPTSSFIKKIQARWCHDEISS